MVVYGASLQRSVIVHSPTVEYLCEYTVQLCPDQLLMHRHRERRRVSECRSTSEAGEPETCNSRSYITYTKSISASKKLAGSRVNLSGSFPGGESSQCLF